MMQFASKETLGCRISRNYSYDIIGTSHSYIYSMLEVNTKGLLATNLCGVKEFETSNLVYVRPSSLRFLVALVASHDCIKWIIYPTNIT